MANENLIESKKCKLSLLLSASLLSAIFALLTYQTPPGLSYLMAYPIAFCIIIIAAIFYAVTKKYSGFKYASPLLALTGIAIAAPLWLTYDGSKPSQNIGLGASYFAIAAHVYLYYIIWKKQL